MHRTRCVSALLLLAIALPAAAQDPVAVPPSAPTMFGTRKNVATARVLAIVPSAGHIYAGETRRGLAFLGGMAGTLAIGTLAVVGDCVTGPASVADDCGSTAADIAVVAFYGVWGWSIYDAGKAAQRTNARRGFTLVPTVAPALLPASGGTERLGVSFGATLITR